MLGLLRESAGDRNRSRNGDLATKFILSRPPNFAAGNKIGSIEIFYSHRHPGIVQQVRIGSHDRQLEFLCGQTLREQLSSLSKSDVSIRLDGDGLVKLRRKGKTDFRDIALVEPIERTAFPSEHWVSRAVRPIGLRGRRPNALRYALHRRNRFLLNLPVRAWFLGVRDLNDWR